MKKLAIVLTICVVVLTTTGCASALTALVYPMSEQIKDCEVIVANQLPREIRVWLRGEENAGEAETMESCLARIREGNANAIADSFSKGLSRGMRRPPVRYGSFKSKATLSDGTVIRSKTKYRTGGWRKTKVETKYY